MEINLATLVGAEGAVQHIGPGGACPFCIPIAALELSSAKMALAQKAAYAIMRDPTNTMKNRRIYTALKYLFP
jgi:hypothetical protein